MFVIYLIKLHQMHKGNLVSYRFPRKYIELAAQSNAALQTVTNALLQNRLEIQIFPAKYQGKRRETIGKLQKP